MKLLSLIFLSLSLFAVKPFEVENPYQYKVIVYVKPDGKGGYKFDKISFPQKLKEEEVKLVTFSVLVLPEAKL